MSDIYYDQERLEVPLKYLWGLVGVARAFMEMMQEHDGTDGTGDCCWTWCEISLGDLATSSPDFHYGGNDFKPAYFGDRDVCFKHDPAFGGSKDGDKFYLPVEFVRGDKAMILVERIGSGNIDGTDFGVTAPVSGGMVLDIDGVRIYTSTKNLVDPMIAYCTKNAGAGS